MEREKFEESVRNSFQGAEISPSDNVWTNIELDLEKEKGGQLKKRLMFYQMLAAASVVFAMGIGSVGFFYGYKNLTSDYNVSEVSSKNTSEKSLAQDKVQEPVTVVPTDKTRESNLSMDVPNTAVPPAKRSTDDQRIKSTDRATGLNPAQTSTDVVRSSDKHDESEKESGDPDNKAPQVIASTQVEKPFTDLPVSVKEKNHSSFFSPKKTDLIIPEQGNEVDPVLAMLARLELREKEVSGEKEKNNKKDAENLWTSVGFAAGSFNTVNTGPSQDASTMMASSQIVDQEAKASGVSYSMGVNLGTKLAERWVFQGGVNYLTHSSDYTANNAVVSQDFQSFRPANTAEVINVEGDKNVNEKIIYTAPYNVNNSLRYLSIPMQAGYLLVNKTFGLQVNAGIATDLFLQNTVKADADKMGAQVNNTTQSSGANSPYRSVNLSGLVGTEFSYRFGEHYRVSLNPGLRYPFNTIYKSNLDVQASPFSFDVGLRFRYIFH